MTFNNGRIGISGSVLFSLNSAELQPEGRELLKTLVSPLSVYLNERNEILMVSGFTDDLPIQKGNLNFAADMVFAAAFGSQQPVASNKDKEGRSKNRRVEMAPVPKNTNQVAVK